MHGKIMNIYVNNYDLLLYEYNNLALFIRETKILKSTSWRSIEICKVNESR